MRIIRYFAYALWSGVYEEVPGAWILWRLIIRQSVPTDSLFGQCSNRGSGETKKDDPVFGYPLDCVLVHEYFPANSELGWGYKKTVSCALIGLSSAPRFQRGDPVQHGKGSMSLSHPVRISQLCGGGSIVLCHLLKCGVSHNPFPVSVHIAAMPVYDAVATSFVWPPESPLRFRLAENSA